VAAVRTQRDSVEAKITSYYDYDAAAFDIALLPRATLRSGLAAENMA
jgi:hypothetical protein